MPQIVSVSRREDVPAFRGEWFAGRLAKGFAEYRNPFSGATHRVSLKKEDVACFVFWSKDFSRFLPQLQSLDRAGMPFLCHYTINSYPGVLEPRVVPAEGSIRTFREIARAFGPERMTFRYDPILISSKTPAQYHVENFSRLAAALQGATKRCVFSFACVYAKVKRRLDALSSAGDFWWEDPPPDVRVSLARALADIAARHGMSMSACCTPDVEGGPIARASCVDAELIARLFGGAAAMTRRNPTRTGCGCSDSRDIGEYGACGHGCVYCYAGGGSTRTAPVA